MKTVLSVLERIEDILCAILKWTIVAILAVMVVIMFLQIILRAFFSTSILWGEEALRYMLIINTFLGIAVAFHYGDLSRFELLSDKLSGNWHKALMTAINIVVLVLLYLTVKGSVPLVSRQMNQLGTSIKIPMGYIYSAIPVSCGFSIYFLLVRSLHIWFGKEEKEASK